MIAWIRRECARWPVLYGALLVAIVAAVTYGNSLDVGFHYDDTHHIVENPHVRDVANVPRYFQDPATFSGLAHLKMYRPVLMTTYALNYSWGGYRPLFWRLTAIALHALTAVGVLLAFRRLALLLRPGRKGPALAGALVAALVFAVHPVLSETVLYASARSSLLATALITWAMFFHLRAVADNIAVRRLSSWVVSLTLFGLALLTKSIAVAYPFGLCVIAFLARRGWKAVLPAFLLLALYLYARDVLLGRVAIDFAPRAGTEDVFDGGRRPISWNLYTQARVLLQYLGLFAFPNGLSIDHHVPVARSPFGALSLLGFATAAGLLVVAWRQRARRPLVSFGIVWFALALAPTSSLIPLNVIMNEHRLYLPGIGFAFVAGALAWPLLRRRRTAVRLAFVALLLAGAARTWVRSGDWSDPIRLWTAATRISPESHGAWNNLGVQIRDRTGDLDRAEAMFHRARACNPRAWEVVFNLASLHLHKGRRDDDDAALAQAETWVRRSLELEPASPRARWTLAEIVLERGRETEARAMLDQLSSEDPWFREMTHFVYARLALKKGRLGEARRRYRDALALSRDPTSARLGLAETARRGGELPEAARHAHVAMQQRPHDPRPYVFLARMSQGARAVAYMFQAQQRGYRPTKTEQREILGAAANGGGRGRGRKTGGRGRQGPGGRRR